jgi:DNA repair protein RecO
MTLLASDALILRTWPVNEADLVVSFFTRDYGKVKGVAKAALKSRKRFGGALEPMTLARAFFAERPRQELVRLDQLELLRSPLSDPVDYARAAVLSFYAEVLEEALPEHDPQETVFRLLLAVLEQTTVEQPWMPLTYFSLWMTRLMGWLPELASCTACAGAVRCPARQAFILNPTDSFARCIDKGGKPALGRLLAAGPANFARASDRASPRSPGRDAAGRIFAASRCNRWSAIWNGGCAPPKPSRACERKVAKSSLRRRQKRTRLDGQVPPVE